MTQFDIKLAKSRLMQVALSDASIAQLIQTGESILQCPMIFFSNNGIIWYCSKNMPKDSLLSSDGDYISKSELMQGAHISGYLRDQRKQYEAHIGKYYYLLSVIENQNHAIGYSWMLSKTPPPEGSKAIHLALCSLFSHLLSRQNDKERFSLLSPVEEALISILHDDITSYSLELQEAVFQGRNVKMFVIKDANDSTQIALDLTILEILRSSLRCQICFNFDNRIVALAPYHEHKDRKPSFMWVLEQYGLIAGGSHAFDRITQIKRAYCQAVEAMRYSTPTSRMTSYETVAFQILRGHFEKEEKKETLYNQAIIKLQTYDRQNGTKLLETLAAYLQSDKNVGQAAQMLGLHRNSVLHRLSRIQEAAAPYNAFDMDCVISLELLEANREG